MPPSFLGMDSSYRRRLREKLIQKQGNRCCYCGRVFTADGPCRPTIEHKRARMDGGRDIVSNLAVACLHCNQHRGRQMQQARQLAARRKKAAAEVLVQ